ncbi:phosphotransferase family enzyme [Isoptericola jiangsuensis]|uniref:Phosphotransferase family enzyme n=1 Tax=Isoptericola jiangsuensis TaxID=548579 RepID=A0A2A9EYC1_9MICO|nr:aminoglycoside phosphotransferase family protein [Isoptericola jiangsuensis]PFG43215.1 phosphotransferase family enzyme [Isoptericola jiangsuensis]
MTSLAGLDDAQRALVARWFGEVEVVADASWGLTSTRVLRLARPDGPDVALKAAGPRDHHLAREIAAHEQWLAPLAPAGRWPRLLHADRERRLLATVWLDGRLVEGDRAERTPDTYRQAGRLLAELHGLGSRVDGDWESAEDARALAWLDGPHRIAGDVVARLRAVLRSHEHPPVRVVPTHGDFQPRNWVVDDRTVRVIDLGRAQWRPARTDLARLARQQLAAPGALRDAFVEGYGAPWPDGSAWRRVLLREAIGTAAWAHLVGDTEFEAQGHRMIAAALADAGR